MTEEDLNKYVKYVNNPSDKLINSINIFINSSKSSLKEIFIKELQKYLTDDAVEYKRDIDINYENVIDILVEQNIDLEQTIEYFLGYSYSGNKSNNIYLTFADEMEDFVSDLSIDIIYDFIKDFFKNKFNIELSNNELEYISSGSYVFCKLQVYLEPNFLDAMSLAEFLNIDKMKLKDIKK